jgi:hypothetical protein
MDDRPQPTPPTDAPNAGDPTGPLRLGDFIIEGVDRVSEEQELSDRNRHTYYHYRYGN